MTHLQLIIHRQMQEAYPAATLFQKLKEGDLIVFKRTPSGSWCKAGEPYFVEYKSQNTAYFRNANTGGGTYDNAWAINQAAIV